MSLRDYLSRGTPESSKRLIALMSAGVLCAVVALLAYALFFQAVMNWAVSTVIAGSFGIAVGFVAALAQQLSKNGFNDGEPK